MSRSQQRRARPMYTPVRGKTTSDITPEDRAALPPLLLSNPRLALGLFQQANLGYLEELHCWLSLRRTHPVECREVLRVAATMGIREKPEQPQRTPCPR